jgi:DnaJ-class molecular chaperone
MSFQIVIIERAGNAAVVKCGSCNGTGESRQHYYCKACNGAGHVTIVCEDAGIPILKCGSCNGSGESRQHYYCKACGGSGALPAHGEFTIRKAKKAD